MSHVFNGVLDGFTESYIIYCPEHDTHGFVGYLPSDQSIYVVLRGTTTIKNWESDLLSTKKPYPDPNCAECEVHTGFYKKKKNIIGGVMEEVARLS
jgi:hypothetical protein